MPRKPRFDLPDTPVHIVQRGNDRQAVFFEDADRQAYLGWLGEAAARHGCAVHAYVLMPNHIHLLATPGVAGATGRMMQSVGRHYVPYVNRRHGRSGALWEGRYRASLIDADAYLLMCMRYIELNPVRADLTKALADYPWSSHRANADGAADALVTPHATYEALAAPPPARRRAYRTLFDAPLDPAQVDALRRAVQTGTPLGGDRFRAQVEDAFQRPVGHARRGRPPKPPEPDLAVEK